MKNRLISLSFAIVMMVAAVMAAPVNPQRAMQVARQFLPVSESAAQAPSRVEAQPSIVYTHPMPKSGLPAFYIVNVDGAFVLVSADDIAHPVLGYNLDTNWPTNMTELPAHIKSFFDDLAAQMEATKEASPNLAPSNEWSSPQMSPQRRTMAELPDSIGPLLTSTWDQGQYYNALCPEDQSGPGGHVWAGCIATAMAQIINYWGQQMPIKTRGIHSYNSNYGTLTVNYDSAHYDFAHMPSALTSTNTQQEIDAVAKLMYDCGVATNMSYSSTESGSYDIDARSAFINHFCFSPNSSEIVKSLFSDAEWHEILRGNLAANHPILYSGQGSGGHAFVCDGYKTDGFYHFNFGWGGFSDGWYLISVITPDGQRDYSNNQSAVVEIVPDSTSNVILSQMTQGTSAFTIDEPLEFYHSPSYNKYPIPSYNDASNGTVYFVSTDTTKQLVADILSYEDQNVRIYDGTTGDQITALYAGGENSLSPAVSTSKSMRVDYQGNMFTSGYHLIISQNDCCRMVSNIITSVDTTTVHLTWTENGSATQWQVEYGVKGFEHSNGTVEIVNSNTITIENLQKFTEYDFYIRPVCGGVWFGPISILTKAPYWIDIVHSQPEGYIVSEELDDYGRYPISIASAEALAWWAKQVMDSVVDIRSSVQLIADVDLEGFLWKPVYEYYGNFDGNGHTIFNMTIVEKGDNSEESGWGFFRMFRGYNSIQRQIIRNLYFQNPNINILRNNDFSGNVYYFAGTGVIAGRSFCSSFINCGVNNGVVSQMCSHPLFSDGELIGLAEETDIINCYANGSLKSASTNVGGLVGSFMGNGSSVSNCYSSTNVSSLSGSAGNLCGSMSGGDVHYFYGIDNKLPIVANNENRNGSINDTIRFDSMTHTLLDSVFFDGTGFVDLLSVLNKWVVTENDSVFRTWNNDTADVNGGYPVQGNHHIITCPNVKNIIAVNIEKNSGYSVRLSWSNEDMQSSNWMVKYWETDSLDNTASYILTDTNIVEIDDMEMERIYNICVKYYCDENNCSGWGQPIQIMFDKPYWTDVVQSQPEGYMEDEDGNVTISSAEGLAWFACLVNGLYNLEPKKFQNKTVTLMSDINLLRYKWLPIGTDFDHTFQGHFNGNNHVISNLYVNEKHDNVGLFGYVFLDTYLLTKMFSNITLTNGIIKGESSVGGILGYYLTNDIPPIVLFDNCHALNMNVEGNNYVGAILGQTNNSRDKFFINCSASGSVRGKQTVGGCFGVINNGSNVVANCFSACDVYSRTENVGGVIGWLKGCMVSNSYSVGSITNEGNYSKGQLVGFLCSDISCRNSYGLYDEQGPLFGPQNESYTISIVDTATFSISGMLHDPVLVNEISYIDLLSALNAWVDANDTAGIYRHWVADTAGVNGGFPIFAPMEETGPTTRIDEWDGSSERPVRKVIRNGHLYILLPDGTRYTTTGKRVE